MSLKFQKDRSVEYWYTMIPIYYTGIRHSTRNSELVLMDDYGKHYVAAYRSNNTSKVGRTFLLKKERRGKKAGFMFKDKFRSFSMKHPSSGWVW